MPHRGVSLSVVEVETAEHVRIFGSTLIVVLSAIYLTTTKITIPEGTGGTALPWMIERRCASGTVLLVGRWLARALGFYTLFFAAV